MVTIEKGAFGSPSTKVTNFVLQIFLSVSFFETNSRLCIYHLLVSSIFSLFHNSQKIIFLNRVMCCLVLFLCYFAYHVINRFIFSSCNLFLLSIINFYLNIIRTFLGQLLDEVKFPHRTFLFVAMSMSYCCLLGRTTKRLIYKNTICSFSNFSLLPEMYVLVE